MARSKLFKSKPLTHPPMRLRPQRAGAELFCSRDARSSTNKGWGTGMKVLEDLLGELRRKHGPRRGNAAQLVATLASR
jgi:hypothetical protein